jgi:ribosomal protein S21
VRKANIVLTVWPGNEGRDIAKLFINLTKKAGIVKEIKQRQAFTPKAQRKRVKSLLARKKLRKSYTKSGEHLGQLERERVRYGGQ